MRLGLVVYVIQEWGIFGGSQACRLSAGSEVCTVFGCGDRLRRVGRLQGIQRHCWVRSFLLLLPLILHRRLILEYCSYIFGKNSTGEKYKMTTPVFTQRDAQGASGPSRIQIVLPLGTDQSR